MDIINYGNVSYNGEKMPILDLRVIPGPESDPEYLAMTWDCVDMGPDWLVFQLSYENTAFISTNDFKENVKVTIYGPQYFETAD